jgi:hypothetical protein
VAASGTAVFITSEDSEAEVHRRLAVIDPNERRRDRPGKLIAVALPDAGGPLPLFTRHPYHGVRVTDEWPMICDQLAKISDLRLVCFDPLSNFAQVALDKDAGEAQFVASHFGMLAAETGATVLASHHMRKAPEAPRHFLRRAIGSADHRESSTVCVLPTRSGPSMKRTARRSVEPCRSRSLVSTSVCPRTASRSAHVTMNRCST